MPLPLAGIALGLGAVGALGSLKSAFDGAATMRKQARLQRATVDEEVRRLKLEHGQVAGTARARGFADGFEAEGGSLQGYLDAMTDEFRRQEDWTRDAGYAGADTLRDQAGLMEQGGLFSFAGGIGGALASYGAAKNWFRKPPTPGGGGAGVPYYLARP